MPGNWITRPWRQYEFGRFSEFTVARVPKSLSTCWVFLGLAFTTGWQRIELAVGEPSRPESFTDDHTN
jgi:hypothetical protein